MSSEDLKVKRGYLKGDFEFFHIKDRKNMQFEFHYHDFNKIILFISGSVTYLIEGKAYKLKPWDILLVSSNEIHKPIINPGEVYERIILYVYPAFLEEHNSEACNLLTCFAMAARNNYSLLRLTPDLLKNVRHILSQLEEAHRSREFGSLILKNALFLQLIVTLNRLFLQSEKRTELHDIQFDKNIEAVIGHINENLAGDLSIDSLAARFFMNKYYLMHKFKTQTGYSIHNYILQKRLILAGTLIRKGKPPFEVSIECGFGDYSNFVRAFKKTFGHSPKNFYKNLLEVRRPFILEENLE